MARKAKYLDAAGNRHIRGQARVRFRNSKKTSFSGWGRLLYWLVFFTFIGATVYVFFFSQFLAITKIDISGTENIDPAGIKAMAEAETAGNFWHFIPRNNILLISENSLAKTILGKYRYARNVEIKKVFPHGIRITIAERKFDMVFCSSDKCYVIDDGGTAFAPADFDHPEMGENNLPIFYDDGNSGLEAGQSPVDADDINYLLGINEKIKNEAGIDMNREFHTPQIASGDIRAKTTEGWQIYFDTGIPLDKEISMLKIVLDQKIGQDQRPNLEYIDLRTDNRIYYKFKNSDEQDASQSQPNKN